MTDRWWRPQRRTWATLIAWVLTRLGLTTLTGAQLVVTPAADNNTADDTTPDEADQAAPAGRARAPPPQSASTPAVAVTRRRPQTDLSSTER